MAYRRLDGTIEHQIPPNERKTHELRQQNRDLTQRVGELEQDVQTLQVALDDILSILEKNTDHAVEVDGIRSRLKRAL
jgi:seryl-tRNA synthetase